MKRDQRHIEWKYLPVGENKTLQMVAVSDRKRNKFTENPDNPQNEFKEFSGKSGTFSLLLLPPCSPEVVQEATSLGVEIIIVDTNETRLNQFLNHSENTLKSYLINNEADFREILSPYISHLEKGQVRSYIPTRYATLDPHLKFFLEDTLLAIQREYCSFSVNRSLKRWHRNLNNIQNINNVEGFYKVNSFEKPNDFIIVGAGPSLDLTVKKLRDVQKNTQIITTDGALKTLLKNGVIPDFIVSCEDTVMSWQFVNASINELKDIPLIIPTNGNHYLIKHYSGPVCLTVEKNSENWVREIFTGLPEIESGRCVGHYAFNLAIYLNASRIIMTGFDLSFRGDVFHPIDMAVPYFHEMKLPVPVTVQGINGEQLRTDLSMQTYLKDFEYMIANTEVEVIDATEGGALKKGTQIKSLDQINLNSQKQQCELTKISASFRDLFNKKFQTSYEYSEAVIESFTSHLVQISGTEIDKKCDRQSAEKLVKCLKSKYSGNAQSELLILSGCKEQDNFVRKQAQFAPLPVCDSRELSELISKIRELEVKKVYCINGSIPPDLSAIEDLECIDIKTNSEKIFNERVLWLKGYRILCLEDNYEFWMENTPDFVLVEKLSLSQNILKVS